MTINMLHIAYTTKVMINQLVKRVDTKGKKAGILITSSIAARIAVPGVSTYCANKGFATMFGQGIHPELAGKVDVLVYEPGTMATKMLGKGPDFSIITPEVGAESSLRHMGMGQLTRGVLRHHIAGWSLTAGPHEAQQKQLGKDFEILLGGK